MLTDRTLASHLPLYCESLLRYQRRRTHEVLVGDVGIGGNNPIRVQSMTTTSTLDTLATAAQAERLVRAGCEIVRVTAPTVKAAQNLGEIRKVLRQRGIAAPLVADIHFSPEAALEAANHVEKVRINPGNYADSRKFAVREYTDEEYRAELERIETRFAPLVLKCKARRIAMRIGTNHGSLSDRIVNRYGDTPEGMVESALEFIRICEKYGYYDVVISMKASNPKVMIAAYRLLAARMADLGMTYPFHLGVTEAGNGEDARIKSAIGIGSLLADGIGDTIRVSLAEEPEAEIPVAFALARRFSGRAPEREEPALVVERAPRWDPIHFARRASESVAMGAVTVGGTAQLAVVARPASRGVEGAPMALRWASPGARRVARPDIVEWVLEDSSDREVLERTVQRIEQFGTLAVNTGIEAARPVLAHLATSSDADLLIAAVKTADGILWSSATFPQTTMERLLDAVATAGKVLWLELTIDSKMSQEVAAGVRRLTEVAWTVRERLRRPPVVGIRCTEPLAFIQAQRSLVLQLAEQDVAAPVFLRLDDQGEDALLSMSFSIGSLLCDGLGDVVQVRMPQGGQGEVDRCFNVLQGAGARISKTDYVACPSCGRTLFDLQTTTDRIKAKSSHLVGVKIAIMGCVVN
ncbi:MAG: (E)-4-hydroxy-3-methylbut-2-enyl-diphosphate synthase, partial [Chloroflexi bacterium]|nr:(E)-4-hydroxy-3-methylbut-2-enyl-diphosphate synthase [Chloroflexota bacterium]